MCAPTSNQRNINATTLQIRFLFFFFYRHRLHTQSQMHNRGTYGLTSSLCGWTRLSSNSRSASSPRWAVTRCPTWVQPFNALCAQSETKWNRRRKIRKKQKFVCLSMICSCFVSHFHRLQLSVTLLCFNCCLASGTWSGCYLCALTRAVWVPDGAKKKGAARPSSTSALASAAFQSQRSCFELFYSAASANLSARYPPRLPPCWLTRRPNSQWQRSWEWLTGKNLNYCDW